ncbi:MAG TPA: tetratricopeptide repeat protein, partial [Verrucomicrobiae bacterium]
MKRIRPWMILALLLGPGLSLRAQEDAEARAFHAAEASFKIGTFDRAEKEFAAFVLAYPESPRVAEAVLWQAQASLELRRFPAVVSLLSTNLGRAGGLADQYRYWVGATHLQSTNYQAAADVFAALVKEFPASARLLEASYGEAQARFKLNDFPRVIELLRNPTNAFQRAAQARPNDKLSISGLLMLAEAFLAQKDYSGAEQALKQLGEHAAPPKLAWQRHYVLCRVQMADRRWADALQTTTNLLALAGTAAAPELLAESVALQSGILEELNQLDAAMQVLGKNLAAEAPVERRRQASLKIIQLTLVQNRIEEAARKLEEFLAKSPEDAASDVVLLTLGELRLKEYLAPGTTAVTNGLAIASTNLLEQALTHLNRLIKDYPQSPLLGKAQLDRGWSLWVDGKTKESLPAFKAAAEQLPFSENQAVAKFKLADVQFFVNDYTNAARNFRAVVNDYGSLPRIRETLLDRALYQMLRASIELQDDASADEAMGKLLEWYPESSFSDRSMLLVGQKKIQQGRAEDALAVFHDFVKRFPHSPLRPEVDLALGRAYVQKGDWSAAIAQYDDWVARFPTNELRPRAEFNRAWANYQGGRETNAFSLFTNFVVQFPTDELAPQARNWVANYYYGQKNFTDAEIHFQLLFQNTNWQNSPLVYQARLMAGAAAYARQGYKDATNYFLALLNDRGASNLWEEAFFALGDTMIQDPEAKSPQKYDEAKVAFGKINPASEL